jgi:hypothetical protein
MTITAKYAGKCRVCGEAIVVGEKIEWSKSGGARHTSCAGKSTSAPSRRQQYGKSTSAPSRRQQYGQGFAGPARNHSADNYDAPMPGCGECARLGRMCNRCAFDEQ